MVRIVRVVASRIVCMGLGPVPSVIGIGPMSIMMPVVVWVFLCRIDEAARRIVPVSMSMKPSRSSFSGNVGRGVFSFWRRL